MLFVVLRDVGKQTLVFRQVVVLRDAGKQTLMLLGQATAADWGHRHVLRATSNGRIIVVGILIIIIVIIRVPFSLAYLRTRLQCGAGTRCESGLHYSQREMI